MSEAGATARQKEAVFRRAQGCCEYCRSQAAFCPDPFSIEHITPRSAGGANESGNLALCCQGCNNIKFTSTTAVDPATGEIVPLYHPRRQIWSEHFAWLRDFTLVIGRTPTGRATVERLQLNRSGVVNLRRVLVSADRHPPEGEAEGGDHANNR